MVNAQDANGAELWIRDIFWGGRVRRAYKSRVWAIAREAAESSQHAFHGNMLSNAEAITLRFLDGGVTDGRGYFDTSSGTFVQGELARAYILYRLGANARALMKRPSLPTLGELTEMITKPPGGDRPEEGLSVTPVQK